MYLHVLQNRIEPFPIDETSPERLGYLKTRSDEFFARPEQEERLKQVNNTLLCLCMRSTSAQCCAWIELWIDRAPHNSLCVHDGL